MFTVIYVTPFLLGLMSFRPKNGLLLWVLKRTFAENILFLCNYFEWVKRLVFLDLPAFHRMVLHSHFIVVHTFNFQEKIHRGQLRPFGRPLSFLSYSFEASELLCSITFKYKCHTNNTLPLLASFFTTFPSLLYILVSYQT